MGRKKQALQAADVPAQGANDPSEGAQPPKPKRARKPKAAHKAKGGSKPKGKAKAKGNAKAPSTSKSKPNAKPQPKAEPEKKAAGQFWRLATITSPTSGREITLELRKDGALVPSDAKRVGIERVEEWVEVRAVSRVEALKAIDAGEGKRWRHSKKGPVEA
jgi:hypothetical protein